MVGEGWIGFLVTLGILAIVVVGVVKILEWAGIAVPQIVYIIAGCIVGILLLIWLGRILPSMIPPG